MRRITALFLILAMLVSMGACGKSKEELDKAKEVDASGVKSIGDAVALCSEYKSGSYEISLKADLDMGDNGADVNILLNGNKNDLDFTVESLKENVALKLEGKDYTLDGELKKPVVVKDGKLYLDLDAVTKGVLLMDTKLGTYGVLLPEMNKTDAQEYSADLAALLGGMIGALAENAEVEEKDGEFQISFKDGQSLKKGVAAAVGYLSDNHEKVETLFENGYNLLNIGEYVPKLVDSISEDLISAGDELGLPITQDYLDMIKSEFEDDYVNEADMGIAATKEEIAGDLEAFKKEIENSDDDTWEVFYEYYEMLKPEISIKATASEYAVKFKLDIGEEIADIFFSKSLDASGSVEFSYTFNTGYVSIFKPSKITTLTDIVKYVKDNKDLFTDKFERLGTALTTAGSDEEMLEAITGEIGAGALTCTVLIPSYLRYVQKARDVREAMGDGNFYESFE